MKIKSCYRLGLLSLLVSSLSGCVGGGGGQVAGIGGTGITSTGTISGFGSIFVNGVEYETGGTAITLDGSSGSESDLQLGMVVTITGTLDANGTTGTATTVEFDDELQGPVDTVPVDPTGDGQQLQFTVLGVTVVADKTATVFDDGVTFDTLAQGDFIELSGYVDQNGVLHATRIEGKGAFTPGVSEVEIKGTATNVSGNTFDLGSYTIDTSGADLSEVPGGVVSNGMAVEVKGTLTGTTVAATEVKPNDDVNDEDVDKASIEGIITDFVSVSDFKVAGQSVDASGASFEPTGLVLADGMMVEVEGPIQGGVLQASKVEGNGDDVELEAVVQSVSTANGTITLQYATGSVTVNVDAKSSLRDDLGVFDPYTLGDVMAGDFLEIEAGLDSNGDIVARAVRRDSLDDDVLRGPVDSCDGTSITILGVSFTLVDGTTSFQDENEAAVYANAAAFCTDVNARTLDVQVKDEVVADGVVDEAELED